ncbi:MAG: hypothetical protein IT436_09205 [Phycisphaerales bacterium]|nr:hypothetical protein [Phycisphaerales bacterium]
MELQKEGQAERLPFNENKPIGDMSLVEIAEQLEKVTSWIEAQRVREREARNAYQSVATVVEVNIREIRKYGQALFDLQQKRMASFQGLLGHSNGSPAPLGGGKPGGRHDSSAMTPKKNIAEAILAIWDLEKFREPLTTEDITDALPDVGYKSTAAPTSLKSSINQALAKLCRQAKVVRYRSDGSRIPIRDTKSRARKYMAARHAPEEAPAH